MKKMNIARVLEAALFLAAVLLLSAPVYPGVRGKQRQSGVAGFSPEKGGEFLVAQAGVTPRRTASVPGLGLRHVDRKNGFAIYPPSGWYKDTRNPRFLVRFSDRRYEAFIIVDSVPVPGEVKLDEEFRRYVSAQNRKVKQSLPSFKVLSNRFVKLGSILAYRTEAQFTAGPNQVLMNIYYVPGRGRLFMITTICPEATVHNWEPLFTNSLATFTLLE